ncbi:hypothetical protein [Nodosilinea nodulosa]|uniref:hypothetical protein n=1 Tax=Nodosilinea nodulosa TaxID=416001 RepID=UPI0002EAF821|nr:hypothetical protein [Nodosilinea nodulosa]
MIRLRHFFLIYLLCGIVFLSGCMVAQGQETSPSPGAQTVLPEFQSLLPKLQQQTQLAIVLPTLIPADALVPSDGHSKPYLNVPITPDGHFQQVVPHLTIATASHYEISLDATADCQGDDSCSFGFLSGEQVFQDTPKVASLYAYELEPDFQPVARSPEAMGTVALTNGITGFFIPFVCGANCDTSKIFWEQSGVRYGVGIRYGSQATLIAFANSVIQNERTNP